MPGETVLVIDDSPTILKVVQLVLAKSGFHVELASDGEAGLAAARRTRPDLILVDFVMPRMNGYQFCRELAADAELKDIPVVLMSAKGDQVGERFVKVMGIVDYITKPFSPEAITAVAQHTIAKYSRRAAEDHSTPLIAGADDVQADPVALEAARADAAARLDALADLRERIATAVAARLAGVPPLATAQAGPLDAAAIADATRAALDDDSLTELARTVDAAAIIEDGPSLRGDLRVVPVAEVLQLLDAQEQSGVLAAVRAKGRVEIYFRKGRVDLAVATGVAEEFLLGRFVLEAEMMTQQELEEFLQTRQSGSLIGSQLVERGHVSHAELSQVLARQTSELIYEILRWRFGNFRFTRTKELPAVAVDASLGLDVEGILMEGFRRVDEWHLIERQVDDFGLVFLRNEDAVAQMGRGRLTREELAILELVNGKNTVKDIIRRSRMGSFDVSKMLYRLLSIKLVRRRVMPVAV